MDSGNLLGQGTPAGIAAQSAVDAHTTRNAWHRAHPLTHVEALYAEHKGAAFALAYRMLGERGMAEDVVQEAFLNIWRQGITYDTERGTARTWLLTIVHHRAIDLLRRQRAKSGADTAIEAAVPLPSGEDTWSIVSERLESDHVRQAIATLPLEQQQVIYLSYFGSLTHAEIAEQLGMPLGTVKGRLRLALEKLRFVYARENPRGATEHAA